MIEVSANYTLAAGSSLSVVDEGIALILLPTSRPTASITIFGSVSATATAGYNDAAVHGVVNSGSVFYEDSLVWLRSGGSLTVASAAPLTAAYGFRSESWGADFTNDGAISVTSLAQSVGVKSADMGFIFHNSGTLSVTGQRASGVTFSNGGQFDNSGQITVDATNPQYSPAAGVTMVGIDVSFRNTGSIVVNDHGATLKSYGLWVTGYSNTVLDVANSGRLEADTAMRIDMQGPHNPDRTVKNLAGGTIIGDVSLSGSNYTFQNSGLIQGVVDLGAGNDTYNGHSGRIDGLVMGGLGDDSLFGGNFDDALSGGAGTNTLFGGAGSDTANYAGALAGVTVNLKVATAQATGWGTDTLSSIENLVGSSFDDTLMGGDDDNTLDGGLGSDTLFGGAGADILRDGGETTNRDFLYGGAGNDTYYVTSSFTGPTDLVYEGSAVAGAEGGVGDVDVIHSNGEFFWDFYGVGEELYIDRAEGSQMVGGTNGQKFFGNTGTDVMLVYGGSNRVDAGAGTDVIGLGLYGLDESYDGVNTVVMKAGSGIDYVYDFESGVDKIDLTAFNFGITGQQVLDQAVNVDLAGTADDHVYFYLTSAGGVDNFIVFMGLQSSQLQASDFVTGTV